MTSEIVPAGDNAIQTSVDAYSSGLMVYLDQLRLPSEGVLVPVPERGKVTRG